MAWRIDRILYQKDKSLLTRMLFLPLYLLSLPYGWTVRARPLLYAKNLLHARCLPCPVISVGNITVGGTGKTPLVMAVAKGLRDRGIPLAILSRGYRRRKDSGPMVSDGKTVLLSPEEAGDEPYLMAKALKEVAVLVGRDRFKNGYIALKQFGVRGVLLDDGFQHLELHRDLNILLIDARIGFGDGHLLPRGILREPLTHLRRADLFVLTKVEDPETCLSLKADLQKVQPSVPVFHSHFEPMGLVNPLGEWEEIHALKGKKILAFSGIANPAYFSFLLRKCGAKIARERIFPDHHHYTEKDLKMIKEASRGLDLVVTTEKDMVKLKYLNIHQLPLRALAIELRIREGEEFFRKVMELFSKRREVRE